MPRWKTLSAVVFLTALMGGWEVAEVEARGFRVNMMPHGNVAGCNTCHTTGGGSARNAFGLAVGARVSPGGNEVFWGAALAALDSDGDGFTNGQELQDPNGTWRSGQLPPGNVSLVTQPGNAASRPQPQQQAPVANFEAEPRGGPAPLRVTFTDSSTNDPNAWAWDFGDGETSTEQNPEHTYAQPGMYTISLTATNASGSNTKTEENFIEVEAAEPAKPSPDFDGDGRVAFSDFVLFAGAFGSTDVRFDLDGDGFVAFSDFVLFAGAFGSTVKPAVLSRPVGRLGSGL